MTRPPDRTAGIIGFALFFLTTACLSAGPVDYVKPLIGTDGHGHVFPGATIPFGMMQLSPDTREETWDGCSGYHYSDTSILGFTHNHLSGTGCADLGNVLLMPTVGPLKLKAGDKPGEAYRAAFSHDQEEARPGYYRVLLSDSKINVELTATKRVGLHRYTFSQAGDAHVILDLWHGIGNRPTDSRIKIADNHTLTGFRRSDGWGGDKVFYFVIEFSRPFDKAGVASDHKPSSGKQAKGRNLQAHVDFKTRAGETILARVALSTVSVAGARKNLRAELPGWDFNAVATAAHNAWNRALAPLQVESRDENFKQTFYTAVYHTMVAPTLLSDVDGQVRGPDGKVHTVKGFDYYTELSFWDTFRAEHPLLTLIQPGRVNDFVKTCLAHYRFTSPNSRYLPVWANGGKETNCMIGNHSIPVIVDAYLKGFRDWNAEEALNDMIASTNLNREFLDSYRDKGYVVQRKNEQSAAKTLEYCYDDICIARLAHALGKPDVARTYEKRARNWQNVFDKETGFMRSRNAQGAWVLPFDPKRIDMSCYTEANAWHYEFFVPHDVPGLIAKLGGDARFVAKLDEMFDPSQKIPNSLQDITGVIGMYAHGNEPCHHVAYLYNYAGAAWKTQALVRQIADTLYNNTSSGVCGNDDCGQTSAWYVFTALGFYPVDPADGVYVIGSPVVDRGTLNLDSSHYGGGTFTVVAKNNSPRNVYIQSATLNGKPYTRSWITHKQIVAGGTLELQMGPKPNTSWGAAAADRPGSSCRP
ncbi:MAG: GH92 family glycosyl hydrolase [Isosphaeraceae bacterium]